MDVIIFSKMIFVLHLVKHQIFSSIINNGMARKYSTPRYKSKTRPGRKPIGKKHCRKLITARVAPESHKYLTNHDMRTGLLIDHLVRKEFLSLSGRESVSSLVDGFTENEGEWSSINGSRETFLLDKESPFSDDPYDVITEQARGLLALIVERGTRHLTQEQIEVLSDNFALLINNFSASFKRVVT